jgi:hypothetical protein
MSFTHVSPRRLAAALGLLAAGVALFVPLPMSASSETACEAMARWAADYERTTPSPTLDDLAKFDRGRRVAIFNAVSAEVKASLFHEQLRRFSERADLTDTQRALIAEGLTVITPALYRKDPASKQAARQFWSRAEPSFTTVDQRRAWYDIGSSFSPQLGATPTLLPSAAVEGNCFCSFGANDCGGGGWSCFLTGCSIVSTGCGFGGDEQCNGECRFNTPSAAKMASAKAGQ